MVTALNIDKDTLAKLCSIAAMIKYKRFDHLKSTKQVYYDPEGMDAFSAWVVEEDTGHAIKTKHPLLLKAIHDRIACLEELADQYARSLSEKQMRMNEFKVLLELSGLPRWFEDQVYKRVRMVYSYGYTGL